MPCPLVALLLVAVESAVPPLTPLPAPTARGEWPQYRGDLAHTGRAVLPGRITHPGVAWSIPVGGWKALVELGLGGGPQELALPAAAELAADYLSRATDRWDTGRVALDLAGDGRLVVVNPAYNVKFARFLPEAKGYQKFVMEDGMAVKSRPGGPGKAVATGSLYRYDRGREELVWTTAEEPQCEIPLCAVADMDADGHLDIAVSTWWRVMVFDGRTGAKKAECKWHNGRNYGHFQVEDLNGDGLPEATVLADFMIHLDLLRNQAGQLGLQWRKEIDYKLFGKSKVLRTLPDSIVRAGDRRLVLANLFNDGGDGRWHSMLWEAMGGEPALDLPDRFCVGTARLTGGDVLLLGSAEGACLAPVGPLAIAQSDGILRALPIEGRWLTWRSPLPETRATIAAGGTETAVVTAGEQGPIGWTVRPAAGGGLIEAWSLAHPSAALASVRVPAGLQVGVAALSHDRRELLLELEGAPWPATSVRLERVAGTLHSMAPLPFVTDVPVVGKLGEERLIISPYGPSEIAAIRPPAQDGTPTVRWHRPGRTRGDSYGDTRLGAVVGELPTGPAVLAAATTPRGEAALVGYGADGREHFRHVFPNRFPGSAPVWNEGGLTHWWNAPGPTVVATLRRSVMHTDETALLDPTTNRESWWCASLLERGAGGQPGAIATSSAGSVLVGQYPDIHYAVALADGRPLVVKPYPNEQLGGWAGYSTPILLDVDDDGTLEVLSSGCRYSVMLWSAGGELKWHTEYLDGSSRQLGVRRGADGWEIGAASYRGGFRCLAARDGKVLWTWPTQPGTDVVTGDVDGDGEEEFLFGVGSRLVALSSEKGQPKVRWELALPARCGPPILADTDADGASEILLLAGDGRLYVVDQAD